ncbi:hypothetical protein P7K49_029884, partial [Saguinus oedipus]
RAREERPGRAPAGSVQRTPALPCPCPCPCFGPCPASRPSCPRPSAVATLGPGVPACLASSR